MIDGDDFHGLLLEVGELYDRKQADYGQDGDPFAALRGSEAWGVPAWVAAMVRATEKLGRVQAFVQRGELVNEPVEDSLIDLAVYALIALLLFKDSTKVRFELATDREAEYAPHKRGCRARGTGRHDPPRHRGSREAMISGTELQAVRDAADAVRAAGSALHHGPARALLVATAINLEGFVARMVHERDRDRLLASAPAPSEAVQALALDATGSVAASAAG